MRTALILLLMLALAAVVGSLVPQMPELAGARGAVPSSSTRWLGAFFDARGLFDVFGSWWFALITRCCSSRWSPV